MFINEETSPFYNICKLEDVATYYFLECKLNKYTKVTDKEKQMKYGDVVCKNHYIDFKFDQYNNDNVVIETKQKSGTTWLYELDENTVILYVKLATGTLLQMKTKDLRDFVQTDLFKRRMTCTAKYSGTEYKNFNIDEIMHNVKNATCTKVTNEYWWKDRPAIMKTAKASWPDSELYRTLEK